MNATGEAQSGPFRLQFDRSVKLAFHGSSISSDGGLLLHRELDDALGLTDMAAVLIGDPRTGRNGRHHASQRTRCGSNSMRWPTTLPTSCGLWRMHERRVHFSAYLPSLMCCSARSTAVVERQYPLVRQAAVGDALINGLRAPPAEAACA